MDLLDKLKLYVNAREEKVRLAVNQQQICNMQTVFEGPLPNLPKGSISLKPCLEAILEIFLQKKNARSESKEETEINMHILREEIPFEEIPKADEHLASSLWRAVTEKANNDRIGMITPPFPFMNASHPLEDKWAIDSLNHRIVTCSLLREHECEHIFIRNVMNNNKINENLE